MSIILNTLISFSFLIFIYFYYLLPLTIDIYINLC